jgi:Protein of unknown function (DUF664)
VIQEERPATYSIKVGDASDSLPLTGSTGLAQTLTGQVAAGASGADVPPADTAVSAKVAANSGVPGAETVGVVNPFGYRSPKGKAASFTLRAVDSNPPNGLGAVGSRERQTGRMNASDPKADLHRYLQSARDALLWKLEGLSEYDIRRPSTPTGTNLLGLVKHAAGVELGYLGDTFGRPSGESQPWLEDGAEPDADMWATTDESREDIVELYRRAWAHADATIDALALETTGRVPWWPDGRDEVSLHHAVVRVISDTHRHAGHADIVRELMDGAVGMSKGNDNMASGDPAWWETHRSRLERVAQEAARRAASDQIN